MADNKKSSFRCFFCEQVSPISPAPPHFHEASLSVLKFSAATKGFGITYWPAGKSGVEAAFFGQVSPISPDPASLSRNIPVQTNNNDSISVPKHEQLIKNNTI
ncbi:MAG: hypothetical protein HGB02_01120 [Chlorobiaceae bacterium]|nr:hypothetical protein [Chlorobiaceae bacterium]